MQTAVKCQGDLNTALKKAVTLTEDLNDKSEEVIRLKRERDKAREESKVLHDELQDKQTEKDKADEVLATCQVELQQKKDELSTLKSGISTLKVKVNSLKEAMKKISDEVDKKDEEVVELKLWLDELQHKDNESRNLAAEIDILNAKINSLKEELRKKSDELITLTTQKTEEVEHLTKKVVSLQNKLTIALMDADEERVRVKKLEKQNWLTTTLSLVLGFVLLLLGAAMNHDAAQPYNQVNEPRHVFASNNQICPNNQIEHAVSLLKGGDNYLSSIFDKENELVSKSESIKQLNAEVDELNASHSNKLKEMQDTHTELSSKVKNLSAKLQSEKDVNEQLKEAT